MPATKTKTECDYLYGWIKGQIRLKSHPKMANPRVFAENAEEKQEEEKKQEENGSEEL